MNIQSFYTTQFVIDALLIPEVQFNYIDILNWVKRKLKEEDKRLCCIVLAEGVRKSLDNLKSEASSSATLNEGASALLSDAYKKMNPGARVRCLIPSITARAASVSETDEALSWRLATETVELIITNSLENDQKQIVGMKDDQFVIFDIDEIAGKMNSVPKDLFVSLSGNIGLPAELVKYKDF
jgi:6-phosphofructokinase